MLFYNGDELRYGDKVKYFRGGGDDGGFGFGELVMALDTELPRMRMAGSLAPTQPESECNTEIQPQYPGPLELVACF